MSLKPTSSLLNHNIGNTIKPKTVKPSIPPVVTTTIKKNETPMSDEHFSLMKAAKQAGLPTNEQKKFADANADGKMTWTKKSDPTPNDDLDVKAADYKKLVGTKSSYKLGEQETANLKQQVKEYVAKGGKLYSNQEVINNPNQAIAGKNGIATPNANTPNVGETSSIIPLGNEPKTRFSVLLNNDGKPITNERVLTQFVQDRYQGGNLWGENYNQIANMSIAQGAKADNINDKGNVGNKKIVYFDVSVKDQVKIHENYKIVQSQVNEVEKIKAEIDDANPVSQFIKGAVDGVKDNLVGTATMIAHPLETLGAIKDVTVALGSLTADDVSNITKAVKGKIKDTFTTKDGINSIPYGAGYAVGMLATDIVVGKGVGIALEAVKEIPAISKLLTKLGDLKSLATAKVAEKFSDEAASLASKRISQSLRNPNLYSGFAGGDLVSDFAVLAGNKMKNGVIPFKEFVELSVKEYGSNIKGKADELAQGYRQAMQKLGFGNDIVELEIDKTSKLAKYQFQKETTAARQKLFDGIKDAENNGALKKIKGQSIDDYNWLNQDPRRKELAFDPDTKSFKVNEARAITEAEKQGLIERPTKRGIFDDGKSRGADYIDANGIEWDMKDAAGGVDKIIKALKDGENVLVDARGLSEANFKTLKSEIELKRPQSNNQVRYVR
jgi:hypothetical protein